MATRDSASAAPAPAPHESGITEQDLAILRDTASALFTAHRLSRSIKALWEAADLDGIVAGASDKAYDMLQAIELCLDTISDATSPDCIDRFDAVLRRAQGGAA